MESKINVTAVKELAGEITGLPAGETSLESYVMEYDVSSLEIPLNSQDVARLGRSTSNLPNSFNIRLSGLWGNMIWRIGEERMSRPLFNSEFEGFLSNMETGGVLGDHHLNPGVSYNRGNFPNTAIMDTYLSDARTSWREINRTRVIPVTYNEFEVRKIVTSWESLTGFINALIGAVETSYQLDFHNSVKQMLFNEVALGVTSRVDLDFNVNTQEGSEQLGIEILNIMDEYRHGVTAKYIPHNNSTLVGTSAGEIQPVVNNCINPVLYIMTDALRSLEWRNVLELIFGKDYNSGNNNEFDGRVIRDLYSEFPTEIIPLNVDRLTEQADIDAEVDLMISSAVGKGFIPNSIPSNRRIVGFMFDPEYLLLRAQFRLTFDFNNAGTGNVTLFNHYDHLIDSSIYKKCVVITAPV